MLGSKAATYAILAVAEIAKRAPETDSPGIQAGELAKELHLPSAYAAKVMTSLARANVLQSGRGPRGGFRLARHPSEIDLLEIIEAVDDLMSDRPAQKDLQSEHLEALAQIHGVFNDAMQQARERLRRQTVADLIPTATTPDDDEPAIRTIS